MYHKGGIYYPKVGWSPATSTIVGSWLEEESGTCSSNSPPLNKEALVIRDINTLPTQLANVVPSFNLIMLKQHNLHYIKHHGLKRWHRIITKPKTFLLISTSSHWDGGSCTMSSTDTHWTHLERKTMTHASNPTSIMMVLEVQNGDKSITLSFQTSDTMAVAQATWLSQDQDTSKPIFSINLQIGEKVF